MNGLVTAKPFLRWAGSKRKLLPELSLYWNKEKRYIEPFVGSASLFFHLNPEKAILGDLNHDLVNSYNVIKTNPVELYDAIISLPRNKEIYYKIRNKKIENMSHFDRAVRFLYLNRLCFNGLYRTNKKNEFNVPFGADKAGNFPSKEDFMNVSKVLKKAKIITTDFEHLVLRNLVSGDFVYLDPPYTVMNRRIFKQYGSSEFGIQDLKRLFNILDYIDKKHASFLLSYAYCDEISSLASKWDTRVVIAQRNIAGFSNNRKSEKEFLISNIS